MTTILVTGGCGFIGSNFVRLICAERDWHVINLDNLTYAGHLENLADVSSDRVSTVRGDIRDRTCVDNILQIEKPWAIVNFAAESHVDRSILDAAPFVNTNVAGTHNLLEASRMHRIAKFLQVSTDEVYGDREGMELANENNALLPSSPYAATKAAADLLCLSYQRTYGSPVLITRSSNNYGPYQFPEKLIPLLILNGIKGIDLPIYGDGLQLRDWIYVEDNCRAILEVLEKGQIGSIYNIGTGEQRTNLNVVEAIFEAIVEHENLNGDRLKERVKFVADRPGHDRRYAINTARLRNEIGWHPQISFSLGLKKTVKWYLEHGQWITRVTTDEYRHYYESVYSRAWGNRPNG